MSGYVVRLAYNLTKAISRLMMRCQKRLAQYEPIRSELATALQALADPRPSDDAELERLFRKAVALVDIAQHKDEYVRILTQLEQRLEQLERKRPLRVVS